MSIVQQETVSSEKEKQKRNVTVRQLDSEAKEHGDSKELGQYGRATGSCDREATGGETGSMMYQDSAG